MKHLSKGMMIIVLSLSLFGCTAAPQDKLHFLNEEPVTVELGSDLDLTLENYLDTSELSEEDLDNITIKLVSAIKNSEGKIDPNAKEVESKELGFGSKAILITLNDEQEVIDVIVKDTTKPEFTKTKDEYEITEGDKLPDIKKDFEAKDLSDVTMSVDTDEVKNDKAGEYKATVTATDTSGNKTEHEVTITVKEKPKQTLSTPSYSGGSSSGSTSSNGGFSSGSGSSSNSGSAASQSYHNSSYAQGVFQIVNEERAKAGLPALSWANDLASAANIRAEELVQNLSHTRPDGSVCFTIFPSGYPWMGENIAWGQTTPADAMNWWMNSPGHRANVLKEEYKYLGVGCYYHGGRYYWVQAFGG